MVTRSDQAVIPVAVDEFLNLQQLGEAFRGVYVDWENAGSQDPNFVDHVDLMASIALLEKARIYASAGYKKAADKPAHLKQELADRLNALGFQTDFFKFVDGHLTFAAGVIHDYLVDRQAKRSA